MAYILKSNGEIVPLKATGIGNRYSLAQLQEAVGGYIEAVPGTNGRVYANEEGRLKGLPRNKAASHRYGYVLVGDVVVLEKGDKG